MFKYIFKLNFFYLILLTSFLVYPKHFILISAPGSGKGTFAQYITKKYNYVHIGTGNIARKRVAQKKGKDSSTLFKIMKNKIVVAIKNNQNFILDNAIGSEKNWELWLEFFKELNITNDLCFIVLEASYKTCSERMKQRLTCIKCGNTCKENKNIPLKNQRCDNCGDLLSIRPNDRIVKNIQKRFLIYYQKISPVINIIAQSFPVITISTEQSLKELYEIYDELISL